MTETQFIDGVLLIAGIRNIFTQLMLDFDFSMQLRFDFFYSNKKNWNNNS